MLRKAMAILGVAMLMVSAACNSITGPVAGGTSGRDGNGAPREPQQRSEKVCLDNYRELEITSPVEGQILHNDQTVLVTFTVDYFCSGYDASIDVSTDGGQSFQRLAEGRNLASALWKLPHLDGMNPLVRVHAWDSMTGVSEERATEFLYVEAGPSKRGEQRD